MKRKVIALLMAAVLGAAQVGCGGTTGGDTNGSASGSGAAGGDAKYNISVILKTLSSEYWQYVKAGADAYKAENPDVVNIEVKGPTSETAFDEMNNMVETDLNAGTYDGLIIAPLQSETTATMVSGTTLPIVAVDTNFEAPEVKSFVGTGNEDAAKKGGVAAVEAAEAAGWTDIQAIHIAGVQGDQTSEARMNGFKAGVEEAGGAFLADEVQYADATADKATAAMEAIMQNHPEGVAIITAHNDDTILAAARVAAGNDAFKDTIFVGFDGNKGTCEEILAAEGTQHIMSMAQMSFEMGYKAVETMVQILNGEEVPEFVDSGAEVVDASNAQTRIDDLNSYLE